METFNIHSICLVKDEADIVGDVIMDARQWSDYIYIYDNGSTDGTTKILKEIAGEYNDVIFFKWSDKPFNDAIRSEIFHAFKHNTRKGDWWCRLDADEFFIDNPRSFLNSIDQRSNAVLNSSYNFYFTDKDLEKYEKNPESFSYKDLKYYKNNWSEIRFVQDNGHLYWPPSSSWPEINMHISEKRIRVKHYQYRSPEQIEKRVKNRKLAFKAFDPRKKNKFCFIEPSDILDLKERIISHEALDCDKDSDILAANDHVPMWRPKNDLVAKSKIYVKNCLFRLGILKRIYRIFGMNE